MGLGGLAGGIVASRFGGGARTMHGLTPMLLALTGRPRRCWARLS
jgi:hypothetical protein